VLEGSETKAVSLPKVETPSQEIIIPRAAYGKHIPLSCEDVFSDSDTEDAEAQIIPRTLTNIHEIITTMIHLETSGITGAQYEFNDETVARAWAIQTKMKGFQPSHNKLIVDPNMVESDKMFALTIVYAHGIELLRLAKNRDGSTLSRHVPRQLMHHKILYFHKNSITKKPLVITGSYNCTFNAREYSWENIIILDDEESCGKFKAELDTLENFCTKVTTMPPASEIDITTLPEPSRRHYLLQPLTAKKINVYMRPQRGALDLLCEGILHPKFGIKEIRGAFMVFADKAVLTKWIAKKKQTPALNACVIVNSKMKDSECNFYKALIKNGFAIRKNRRLSCSDTETMHNKFCIATRTDDEKIIITGSEHPNENADSQSWQNTVVLIKPDEHILAVFEAAYTDLLANSEAVS